MNNVTLVKANGKPFTNNKGNETTPTNCYLKISNTGVFYKDYITVQVPYYGTKEKPDTGYTARKVQLETLCDYDPALNYEEKATNATRNVSTDVESKKSGQKTARKNEPTENADLPF